MRVMAVLALLVALLVWIGWSRSPGPESSRVESPGKAALGRGPEAPSSSVEASRTAELGPVAPPTLADLLQHIDRPGLEDLERRLLAALADDPDNGELATQLCDAARLLGHFDEAAEHGELAVSLRPQLSRAHHLYAKALGEQMRNGGLFTAIRLVGTYKQEMTTAIALDAQNFRARAEQIAFLLFMPAIGGGDKDLAAQLADLLEDDDLQWGLPIQALVRAVDDDDAGAIVILEDALKRFPDDQEIAVTLAGLLEDVGRNDEADQQFATVLAGPRSEAYYLALYQRARLHIRAGERLAESVAALEAYVAAQPYGEFLAPMAEVHYRMGSAWEQFGEVDKARAAYAVAIQLDPDYEKAEEALEALEAAGEG